MVGDREGFVGEFLLGCFLSDRNELPEYDIGRKLAKSDSGIDIFKCRCRLVQYEKVMDKKLPPDRPKVDPWGYPLEETVKGKGEEKK